jgi:hypothetical protein
MHGSLVYSPGYYENKKALLAGVRPLLRTLLGRDLLEDRNHDGSYSDGTIIYSTAQTIIGGHLLHFELRNEIGAGATDATPQAGLLYRKFWSHKEVPIRSPPSMFTYQLIRKQAVPSAALRSYLLSWDHGCACSVLFSQTNPLFNL